jgi:hypothetical protein
MNRRPSNNPWMKLPKRPPFVLQCDKEKIEKHNKKNKEPRYQIKDKVLPEPFIGNPNAELWLLNLNPGFEKSDEQHTSETIAMQWKSLFLMAKEFWYIDPKYATAAGFCWWRKVLHDLIAQFGFDQVKKKVFCVEFFPYHSKNYKWSGGLLESQDFTIKVVEWAIKERKRFIILRRKNWWLDKSPLGKDLKRAPYACLRSPQYGVISKKNLKMLKGRDVIREVFGASLTGQ